MTAYLWDVRVHVSFPVGVVAVAVRVEPGQPDLGRLRKSGLPHPRCRPRHGRVHLRAEARDRVPANLLPPGKDRSRTPIRRPIVASRGGERSLVRLLDHEAEVGLCRAHEPARWNLLIACARCRPADRAAAVAAVPHRIRQGRPGRARSFRPQVLRRRGFTGPMRFATANGSRHGRPGVWVVHRSAIYRRDQAPGLDQQGRRQIRYLESAFLLGRSAASVLAGPMGKTSALALVPCAGQFRAAARAQAPPGRYRRLDVRLVETEKRKARHGAAHALVARDRGVEVSPAGPRGRCVRLGGRSGSNGSTGRNSPVVGSSDSSRDVSRPPKGLDARPNSVSGWLDRLRSSAHEWPAASGQLAETDCSLS